MNNGSESALDLRGLKCPLPVLKTRRHMRDLATGTLIRIETTDPLAVIDIPNLVAEMGYRLAATEREGERSVFVIEKSAPTAAV